MLIDALSASLDASGAVADFWAKLDAGEDAAVGVAFSARPFMVAARFAHRPQTTLVVTPGEDAADAFARNVAAYVGEERVLTFPDRTDNPFDLESLPNPKQIAARAEALWALQDGRACIVVASARSLMRRLVPAAEG